MSLLCTFKIGDLVRFDTSYALGVVVSIKKIEDLSDWPDYENHIYDVLVRWVDGDTFWCMDFTLEHVLLSAN
tara:strand:+ start:2109 stop:2324 length:216 start_codon:yes stop_codon:yes gene_type:complete